MAEGSSAEDYLFENSRMIAAGEEGRMGERDGGMRMKRGGGQAGDV